MLISFLFLLLFGILGVNFFKGRLFYCYGKNIPTNLVSNISYKWECLNAGGDWVNADNNFDNIFNSLVALFNSMSSEGWSDIMYSGTDVVDFNITPQVYYDQYNMIFFFIFQIIGHMFVLNLFVGVVIRSFDKEQRRLGKDHLLTPT